MTLEEIRKLQRDGVPPVAEFVAAAGPDYGWVKVWEVPTFDEVEYLVYWGDNSKEDFDCGPDYPEDLAYYIEDDTARGLEKIVQTANIRGADAVTPAAASDEGPFYIIETRYWHGPRETSGIVIDDSGRDPLEFETLDQARSWIERAMREVYHLAHGEYARPTYKVVTT